MHASPCTAECQHLIAIAQRMATALGGPSAKPPATLVDWLARAEALVINPQLESLDGEQMLENLSLDLRRRWLNAVHAGAPAGSDRYMMSPPHAQAKYLADGTRVHYPYDRWLKPRELERRLAALHPPPSGWAGRSMLFANGMSAIATTLQVLRVQSPKMWPRAPKFPYSLHWFGGYFEIARALELLCNDSFHGRKHAHQPALCTAVMRGAADVVLIEPVAADTALEVFDLDAFIAAWKQRHARRPCAIVIDNSLSADVFPVERLCVELADDPPVLIASIRSGLKLDQEGLEFSNVGLVDVWMADTPAAIEHLDTFANALMTARTTFGACLSQDEYAALSAPLFLDATSLHGHARAVFANNRLFAETLAARIKPDTSVLGRVSHPCLGAAKDRDWAEAPFVVLRYHPDGASARAFLRTVLEHEARQRKLTLRSGSSFGFRGHRFEMGFVRGVKFNSMRIAMGARRGPSLDGVVQLFSDLAAYPDFAALRKAYPQIEAQHPKDRVRDET